MCRCLLYMNDVELSLMDKEVTGVDESEDVLNLVESGYAGATYMGAVYVPEDVKAAYCKNCDEEWKEEQKKGTGYLSPYQRLRRVVWNLPHRTNDFHV